MQNLLFFQFEIFLRHRWCLRSSKSRHIKPLLDNCRFYHIYLLTSCLNFKRCRFAALLINLRQDTLLRWSIPDFHFFTSTRWESDFSTSILNLEFSDQIITFRWSLSRILLIHLRRYLITLPLILILGLALIGCWNRA